MSVKAQSSFINSPTALRIKVQRPQHYPWSHYHHFSHLLSLTSANPSSQSTHGPLCSSTSPSLPGVHPCPSLCLKHFSVLPFWQILAEGSLSPGSFSSSSTLLGQLLLSEHPGPSTQLYQFTSLCLIPLKMWQATTTTEALKYLCWIYSKFPW